MNRITARSSLFILCIAILTQIAFAQSSGMLQGTITDPSGAVIPGAKIVVEQAQSHFVQTVQSDGVGKYAVGSLQPGTYQIEATADGFKSAVLDSIIIKADQTASANVQLSIFASQNVEVRDWLSPDATYAVKTQDMGPLGYKLDLDTANSVNTIPSNLIDNEQPRTFADLIKYLPSALIEARGGIDIGRPETRGFEGDFVQNSRVNGLTAPGTIAYAMEEFDQLEVLNGLAGAMYGPTAPAGMFNLVTKRPTDVRMYTLGLDYDSQMNPMIRGDLGGRLFKNGILGYRINLLHQNGTGYVDDSHRRRDLAAGAFDVRLSSKTVAEFDGSHFAYLLYGYPDGFAYSYKVNSKYTAVTSQISLPAAPDPTREGYGQSYAGVNLVTNTLILKLKHEINSNWHVTAGGLYQSAVRDTDLPTDTLIDNSGHYTAAIARAYNRFSTYSNLLYINGQVKTGGLVHNLVLGSNGYDLRNPTGFFTASTIPLNTTSNPASLANPVKFSPPAAVFAKAAYYYESYIDWQQALIFSDTVAIGKSWSASFVGSMDWLLNRNFTNNNTATTGPQKITSDYGNSGFSPLASLLYKPKQNMSVYFTYANSLQQGGTAPATGVANPNAFLPPYRSTQYEAGYKIAFPMLEANVAAFRMNRPFAFVDPITQMYRVEGNQLNDGLEFMVKGKVTHDLNLFGGATWINPELQDTGNQLTSGKQVVAVPRIQTNILADYQVNHFRGVAVNANLHYTGRRAANDLNSSWANSYTTFDLGGRYERRILGMETTWRFTAENLTNKDYWISIFPGAGASTLDGTNIANTNGGSTTYSAFLGAPRTISAGIQIRFLNGR
jgi:iron complex outermembrane receptor protein